MTFDNRLVSLMVKPGRLAKFSWQYEGNESRFSFDSSPAEKTVVEVIFNFPPNSINRQGVTIQSGGN